MADKYSPKCAFFLFTFLCFSGLLTAVQAQPDLASPVSAQTRGERTADGRSLQIGDTIPEELWNLPLQVVNHPDNKETITLNEYRDKKLIILDFWATWCGTCIAALPRLHHLERDLKGEVAILPVTGQKAADVGEFLKKNPALSVLDMMSVTDDTVYKSRFPYTMLPHEVWIDSRGEVVAVTHSRDVTAENIGQVLSGNAENIAAKSDNLTYDRNRPLLIGNNGEKEDAYLSRSIFTAHIPGIPSLISQPKPTANGYRAVATNATAFGMYGLAFPKLRALPRNRIIKELSDDSAVRTEKLFSGMYCYDTELPISSIGPVREKIRADLDCFFGISARMEPRNTTCRVLRATGEVRRGRGRPEDGQQYLSSWLYRTNRDTANIPLIAEGNIGDVLLPATLMFSADTDSLNTQLEAYGIKATQEERMLDYFIISDQ